MTISLDAVATNRMYLCLPGRHWQRDSWPSSQYSRCPRSWHRSSQRTQCGGRIGSTIHLCTDILCAFPVSLTRLNCFRETCPLWNSRFQWWGSWSRIGERFLSWTASFRYRYDEWSPSRVSRTLQQWELRSCLDVGSSELPSFWIRRRVRAGWAFFRLHQLQLAGRDSHPFAWRGSYPL